MRNATEIGLLETSDQLTAASQSGRRIPKRGRKTVMLNGPIIQAIRHMMKKADAARAIRGLGRDPGPPWTLKNRSVPDDECRA